MPVERAVRAFQHERKSCAESILHAFREHRALSEEEWRVVASGGHGRGEGGLCGALSAALQLAPGDTQREQVRSAFVAQAGSEKCRDIRQARAVPCRECVRIAATLLAGHVVPASPTTESLHEDID